MKSVLFFWLFWVEVIVGVGPVEKQDLLSRSTSNCHWDYDETEQWGEICPQYSACSNGTSQSPIIISRVHSIHCIEFNKIERARQLLTRPYHTWTFQIIILLV